jgi:hypothetical protein
LFAVALAGSLREMHPQANVLSPRFGDAVDL